MNTTTKAEIMALEMAISYEEENFNALLEQIRGQAKGMPTDDQLSQLDRKAGFLNGMIFALSVIEEAGKNAE